MISAQRCENVWLVIHQGWARLRTLISPPSVASLSFLDLDAEQRFRSTDNASLAFLVLAERALEESDDARLHLLELERARRLGSGGCLLFCGDLLFDLLLLFLLRGRGRRSTVPRLLG